MNDIVLRIAYKVKEAGGKTYYVGGYVRDKLLGIDNKDIDIEVHGIEPSKLEEILNSLGNKIEYGSSFAIYSLKGYNIDIALPRSEKPTGKGHKDFEIEIDPFIGEYKAARRRDFTINSLMQDVISGEIVDSFGGIDDLNNKIIRHVDAKTFIEDPLRVLRAAQFASRFNFAIAEETIELCKSIDLSFLSKERIEEELKKALIKGQKPSIFFKSLRQMNQLDYWFKEVKDLIDLKQDSIYHPEGDVYIHTMEVIDRAVIYRDKLNTYPFMLLCLCHDFGKITTSQEINGRIHAYNHEIEGLPIVESFIKRITNHKDTIKYLKNMVPLHMLPNRYAHDNSSDKSFNKMFDKAIDPEGLIYFSLCDAGSDKYLDCLLNKYETFQELMKKPYVKGEDLINNGLNPNDNFSKILDYAHTLRLAAVDKDSALKQCLAYARKLKSN